MDQFLVAVTLYVREGQEAGFSAYELGALTRMKGYKGELLARMRCSATAKGEQEPYEFHLLSFPSEAAFSSFVASGVAYQQERDRVIEKTTIVVGTSLNPPTDP